MRLCQRQAYLHELDVVQVFHEGCQAPDGAIHSRGVLALVYDTNQLPKQLRPVIGHIPLGNSCKPAMTLDSLQWRRATLLL